MMIAQVCDLEPGEFVHTFGDTHLYSNHIEQAKLQLSRDVRPLPTMKINPEVKNIFDFKFEYKVCMTVSICLSEVFSDRHIVAIRD